jgi:hypothetical protein
MIKQTLSVLVILFLALSVAGAKDYTVAFATAAQVGGQQLEAGEYKMKIEGATVSFVAGKKSVSATAKTEKIDKKARYTSVETSDAGGVRKVTAITIEGSDTKFVFNN